MTSKNVSYTAPEQPSFLKKLRAQHGIKTREEQHKDSMAMKKAKIPSPDDEDDGVRNVKDVDEMPVVVVLKKNDLTQEEARELMEAGASGVEGILMEKSAEEKQAEREKRKDEEKKRKANSLIATTGGTKPAKKTKTKKSAAKLSKALNKKNTNVLSFEEED